ncbi:protein of unknown function [Rhodovastum atsumiense]|nr:protein of unknown function [Rhodovastum atsumiense]
MHSAGRIRRGEAVTGPIQSNLNSHIRNPFIVHWLNDIISNYLVYVISESCIIYFDYWII